MKRKFLVASHGHFASGLQHSIDILTGRGQDLEVIDAYVDDTDYTPQLVDFIHHIGSDEQGVIITDLVGGSVNQKVVQQLMSNNDKALFVVSNANLAVLLSLLYAKPEEKLTQADIQAIIGESQVQLLTLANEQQSDDEFFD